MARDDNPRDGSHGSGARRAGGSRRSFLRAAGLAGAAGLSASAGCVSSITDSTGGQGLDTLTFGVLSPVSGPFAPLGQAQRQAAKLAVEYVNDSDDFDFSVEAVYEDTETDAATGAQRATKVIEQDDVDVIAGCANSSVALAVSDTAADEGVVYTSGGAAMALTGAECNQYTFRNETNTAQQAAGLVGYAFENLGSNMWIHTADYAYGNSAITEIRNRMDELGVDGSVVDTTTPDLGTSNFSPYISQIANSEADVLAIPLTGGDLINFIQQANNQGLKDQVEIIGTAIFAQTIRGAVGPAAQGMYSSTLYNHKLDTGDNQQFDDAYRNSYDGPPGSFARVGYEAVRMPCHGAREAGSSDPDDVRTALEGLEIETVLGTTEFRGCDHQSTNPVWTARMVAPDSGETTDVELLEKVPGEQAIPPCDAVDCSM